MKQVIKEGVTLLQVDTFNIRAGFSTRYGGVSQGHYKSMNLRLASEDSPENLKENLRRFIGAIGVEENQVVFSDQVHLAEIQRVEERHKGMGITQESDFFGKDGLITNIPGICLMTFHADCIPIYFYDQKAGVVGLAHGGWKGTLNRISEKMLVEMITHYGCQKEDIQVFIGPGICQDCYQVSPQLIENFRKVFPDEAFYTGRDQRYLDLKGIHKYQCLKIGLLDKQIRIDPACTHCQEDLFYSHRRSGINRGGHMAYIVL